MVNKKEKNELARQVTEAVIKDYDFAQEIDAPIEELIGIETQKPDHDIIPLEQMNQLIDKKLSSEYVLTALPPPV